ncbi:MAG: hypothetical protein ACJAXN_003141 [Psychromonas sp.]|jgi:hypothetical protein
MINNPSSTKVVNSQQSTATGAGLQAGKYTEERATKARKAKHFFFKVI